MLTAYLDAAGASPRPNRLVEYFTLKGLSLDIAAYEGGGAKFVLSRPSTLLIFRIFRRILKVSKVYWLRMLFEAVLPYIKFQNVMSNYDVIFVHDLFLLPAAVRAKARSNLKIIFDAREYYTHQHEGDECFDIYERGYREFICKKYFSEIDLFMTVSRGIADRYSAEYGVKAEVFLSSPILSASHEAITVGVSKHIRMVHHGVANRNRRLENMIQMFEFLDCRFKLDFYLVGDPVYIDELKKAAEKFPSICFRQAVPYSEIGRMLSDYDIGLYLLQPTGFNTEYCLPNKFFEFLHAGLMLAIGPSPEMKRYVESYKLGVVSKSFSPFDLASELNCVTHSSIRSYKASSGLAAKDLCFDKQFDRLCYLMRQRLNVCFE